MTRRQTILGFFDNAAEAQQAVQLLLSEGFTRETVELSTPTGPNAATGDSPTAPTEADPSSGRFFSSLFGNLDSGATGGTLVRVQIPSAAKAKQVADLFEMAGAGEITVASLSA